MKYLAIVSLVFITGCSFNPYQKASKLGGMGYFDKKLGEGHYIVTFGGRQDMTDSKSMSLWETRVLELCPNGYEELNFDLRFAETSRYGGSPGIMIWGYTPTSIGEVKCKKVDLPSAETVSLNNS